MPDHKFKIGQTVILSRAIARNMPGGMYEITQQLPKRNGEYEYRIKKATTVAPIRRLCQWRCGSFCRLKPPVPHGKIFHVGCAGCSPSSLRGGF